MKINKDKRGSKKPRSLKDSHSIIDENWSDNVLNTHTSCGIRMNSFTHCNVDDFHSGDRYRIHVSQSMSDIY